MIPAPHDINLTLQRLAKDEETALVALFNHYKDGVYDLSVRITRSEVLSEEIVQDIFTKVWIKREELTGMLDFSGWMQRATRNRSYDVLRAIARRRVNETEMVSHIPEQYGEADHRLETAELKSWVAQAVSKLTKEQRMAFDLIREQGMSREEAAQEMGLSPNTVKVHLLHATRAIRGHLILKGVVIPAVLAAFPVFL